MPQGSDRDERVDAVAARRRKRADKRRRRGPARLRRPRLPGPLRPRAGRAAAVAGRLRPAPGRGGEARARRACGGAVQSLTRPPKERLTGPAPQDERRAPAGAGGRLGPRPPLVARPHGALEPAAGRAHDARLARLVRDLQRRRRLAAPDAAPERALPQARRSARSRTCCCASRATRRCWSGCRASENTKDAPERELRARADGAVHARRRPRLHRARRARAGARADRVPGRLGRRRRAAQLPLRPRAPRRGRQAGPRQAGPLRLARLLPAVPASTAATRRSSSRSCGRTSSRSRPGARRGSRSSACTCASGYEVRPVVEAILQPPDALQGPAHGEAARSCTSPGCCAA